MRCGPTLKHVGPSTAPHVLIFCAAFLRSSHQRAYFTPMTPIPDDSQGNPARDRQVNELIALYLRAVERGDEIDPHAYIAMHSQYAFELSRFFADSDNFRSDASPSSRYGASVSTSTSLLARVKANETDAWSKLSRLYGPLVYSWTRRMNLQSSDAADVVQEVFLAVSLHVTQFHRNRPNDSFRGWLWTITRNKVRDHFRRQGKQLSAEGGSEANSRVLELPD